MNYEDIWYQVYVAVFLKQSACFSVTYEEAANEAREAADVAFRGSKGPIEVEDDLTISRSEYLANPSIAFDTSRSGRRVVVVDDDGSVRMTFSPCG